jgi:hypothetical protein
MTMPTTYQELENLLERYKRAATDLVIERDGLRLENEALRHDAERWKALEHSVDILRVYVVPATGNSLSGVFELRRYFDYSLCGEGE